jgi:hypothetical protein
MGNVVGLSGTGDWLLDIPLRGPGQDSLTSMSYSAHP